MCFLALGFEDGLDGWSPTPACAGRRTREVLPKADALSSKLRREAFQDEIAMVMTASLRSPTIEGLRAGRGVGE
jgi:hypothetical protein